MPRGIDAFLAELGLERAEPTGYERGDDPGSQIQRAGLTHEVLHRILESAERLAPFLKLSRDVVFGLLTDLVIEEAERAPFGLVATEQVAESAREPATPGSVSLQELLARAARMADTRHGRPRAPEWAVPLDAVTGRLGSPYGPCGSVRSVHSTPENSHNPGEASKGNGDFGKSLKGFCFLRR